jgi:acetylornithine deacetylase/succinyl-diaminopimelate desuccinylase-like protein
MASARVGAQASNVVPSTATASIDIRLVKGMDPQRTCDRVLDHIRSRASSWSTGAGRGSPPGAPESVVGAAGRRRRVGHPHLDGSADSQEVIRIVERVRGSDGQIPNMGGSLPLAPSSRPLGAADDRRADRQSRQPPAQLRREPAPAEPVGGIELMAALLQM